MNRKILLYNHAGCENHGCEAIVRTTSELFKNAGCEVVLSSGQTEYDRALNLPCVDTIIQPGISPYSLDRLINSIGFRLGMPRENEVARKYSPVIREGEKCGLCLSVGGDTYCYGRQEHMRVINSRLKARGIPLVLWGCSIDPELLTDELISELKDYDLIVARESISAEAMRSAGLRVVRKCDPAFLLKADESELPGKWKEKETVGLNISPLVLDHMGSREEGLRIFEALIRHILDTTAYSVALFSHVIWNHDNDAWVNSQLSERFHENERVFVLPDALHAEEIKGCISRMKLVITARTHASIAAYSTFVPTLVIGYSVKARGIAKDLFGTEEGHVLASQKLKDAETLIAGFDALNQRASEEQAFLKNRIPEYCRDKDGAFDEVLGLMK